MKNKTDSSIFHAECEALIVAGQVAMAQSRLKKINAAQVPRADRLPLANLCRRVRLIGQGLRLLKPLVRSDDRHLATDTEKVEYAILLERAGSVTEALTLLSSVNVALAPEANFAIASCHVGRWDYEPALSLFADYVLHASTPYAKLIGRVNLGAAMVFTKRDQEALPAIDECLAQAKELNAQRLTANAFELRAQLKIRVGQFSEARSDLEEAALRLRASNTRDRLYIEKWRAVVEAHEKRDVSDLIRLRTKALSLGDFETCRDLDFQTLQIRFDEVLYQHLYFGTPYPAYRENLRRSLNRLPSADVFTKGEGNLGSLDLVTGEVIGTSNTLKSGGPTHALCAILGRDFYGRSRPGTIFGELYPGEYFDIHSSLTRIRQAVVRARRELLSCGSPVVIEQKSGTYYLVPAKGFGWRVGQITYVPGKFPALLLKLRSQFDAHLFSAQEAAQALELSPGQFRRFAVWALSKNHCFKMNRGPHTLYTLAANSDSERRTA